MEQARQSLQCASGPATQPQSWGNYQQQDSTVSTTEDTSDGTVSTAPPANP
jgi:hypothetical protein